MKQTKRKQSGLRQSQITYWCHSIMMSQAASGGVYVDATMGNGNDTLFLCQMAGKSGTVWAFDIQEQALDSTRSLLAEHGYENGLQEGRIHLIQDGHENMDQYLEAESADAVCFNFGYLPGGDHGVATRPDTSVTAVRKALDILKSGGMMSLCIYSGGDTGFEEKEAVLGFVKELPARDYTVIVNEYYNRGNHPPMPVFIFKR